MPDPPSSAVGTISSFHAFGGLNVVCDIPKGPKISRWQKVSSGSSARRSSAIPRMIKPMSLYSARVPGSAVRLVVKRGG